MADQGANREWRGAAVYVGALTLLQALPWLWFLCHGISLISCASESIGYRYFHSLRLVRGEQSTIWEAQGHTVGVLHEFFQWLLDRGGITDLRVRIDLFSYGTLAANSLVFGFVACRIARSPLVDLTARYLIAAVALFGVYGSWWGLAASRLPDYYTWEVTLTTACLGLFVVHQAAPARGRGLARATALGALAGAMAGVKITLLPAAFLPLLPLLLVGGESLWRRLLRLAVWGLAAAATLAALVAAYYLFDFDHLRRAFHAWKAFVAVPGAEPGFIRSLLHPFAPERNPWADHRFVPVIGILWVVALITYLRSARMEASATRIGKLALGLLLLLLSALHIVTVFKRPAETTLFETALFFSAAAGGLLACSPAAPHHQRIATAWLTLLAGWCALSAGRHLPAGAMLAAFRDTSRHAWEIHKWLNASERPVIILLPDNRHVSGTVEEALLKGFSDVPTWNITTGYPLLDSVAPRRLFVTRLSAVLRDSVLLWTDGPDLPGLLKVSGSPPAVLGQLPRQLRSWKMQRNQFWSRTVHAAVFDSHTGRPAETVLLSNEQWAEATTKNPAPEFSISPVDAAPIVELRAEGGQRVVRVTATKPSAYLALGGAIPPLPDGAGPLRLESVLRTDTARTVLWQIYDVISIDGAAESVVEPIDVRSHAWTRWALRKPLVRQAASADNFSVGIVAAQPGDWFEISALDLVLEARPTTPSP